MDEMEWLINDSKIDILGIAESWGHEEVGYAELSFEGFAMFRRARSFGIKNNGGGVLYIRESLHPLGDNLNCESVWASFLYCF